MPTTPTRSLALHVRDGRVFVPVRVQPRASRDGVVGVLDGALKVALTAPPVDGEANAALVRFLAKRLGVPRRDVEIVQGTTARQKLVAVSGLTLETVMARLVVEG